MEPLLIPCPQCGKELRLRDRSLLGKKGKCPKCRHRFLLRAPTEGWSPDEVKMELVDSARPSAFSGSQPAVGTSARWIPDEPAETPFQAVAPSPTPPPTAQPAPNAQFPQGDPPPASISPPADEAANGLPAELDIQATSSGGLGELQRIKRRSSQRMKIGIGIGAATAVAVVLAVVFANQAANDDNKPPQANKEYEAELQDLEENLAVAQRVSPTKGSPIKLLYVPAGAQIIINVHPAALWQEGSLGEEFRFGLGGGINSWAEEQLKEICRFEPAQIAEATICLLLGARGTKPEVAAVVRLVEEQKKSDLLLSFGAERDDSFGRPIYLNEENAFVIIDTKTFAVGPRAAAGEMIDAMRFPNPTDPDIEELIHYTDRDRLLTVIFEPLDLRNFQDVLAPEETRPLLNLFVDWFGEDVSTVAWSLHIDQERFHSELLLRNANVSTPRRLHKEFDRKLKQLPEQVLGAVSKMNPQKRGHRMIIGRFPAMVYGYSVSTIGGIGDRKRRYLQLTTVLPERAAPNLSTGLTLTWLESLRTDFTKEAPDITEPRLPELLAERLKLRIEVDFRRTPLHEAFAYIGSESHVRFDLDGDALKAKGMTQNMAQNQNLGNVPAIDAVVAIISQYKDEGMCVVVDEAAKLATVTTLSAVEAKNIQESPTLKIIRPTE